jgi:hypothetical protein
MQCCICSEISPVAIHVSAQKVACREKQSPQYCFQHLEHFVCVCVCVSKGKVVPVLFLTEHHPMKVYWGNGGIVALIFSLTSALNGGEWSASHPGRFTPGKEPWHPLDRRLGGFQSRSGCCTNTHTHTHTQNDDNFRFSLWKVGWYMHVAICCFDLFYLLRL